MADRTDIEWTDATWNPITGCSVVSPGCTNCYAMRLAGTRLKHSLSRADLTIDTKAGPVWNGALRFNEQWLDQPLRWKRPRRIFVCAHGDLFHENAPDAWIDRVFAVMALSPQHTFQVLTKRAERMRVYLNDEIEVPGGGNRQALIHDWCYRPERYFGPATDPTVGRIAKWPDRWHGWPLPNVWLGVSVEDQKRADERIPQLLATPAAKRFISAEPLLGPIQLPLLRVDGWGDPIDDEILLDWVIAGGESGKDARPVHPEWARGLRDQCAEADVPFFFKQWGAWRPIASVFGEPTDEETARIAAADEDRCEFVAPGGGVWLQGSVPPPGSWLVENAGKKAAGALLDGREHREFPA